MKETKFTKGEWLIFGDWGIKDKNDRLIAQFEPLNDDISPGNTDESFANAHLIAAAPEMYDLLSTIESDSNQVPTWLWDRIQQVLAKARGEL